jgi:hypothetical protein
MEVGARNPERMTCFAGADEVVEHVAQFDLERLFLVLEEMDVVDARRHPWCCCDRQLLKELRQLFSHRMGHNPG